ncbi:hypothetical protein QZH41_002335 [Actinostola sp. cb2023]|nr:hypothetical protein QZH41_002335 [Actinostola sp. cb2023]
MYSPVFPCIPLYSPVFPCIPILFGQMDPLPVAITTSLEGGVMFILNPLKERCSYGSLARFRAVSRLMKANGNTVIGASGDYADFQYMKAVLEQKIIDDACLDDGHGYTPQSIFSWLTRVMYFRRTKFNPLWNQVIVGGFYKGESFLGYIDKIGIAYQSDTVATGFGAYLAQPMLRDAFEKNPNLTQEQARNVIIECLKVLFYRDARSLNKFEIAIITKDGTVIEEPQSAETNWDIAPMVNGLIDAGIYVVIGQLALTLAGPAVIISFLIAAVAAVFSGLCYAELSSRITKTGSAYVFTYVILGEVWAFVTGWSMIAEYIVNAASMARAFSGYINSLTGDAMFDLFKEKLWWGNEGLFGHFPNFPALGLVILAAIIVGLGVRESKTFMDAMTSINGAALVSAIVAGAVLSDPSNWSSMDKFAPNGVSGILMAAPSCFYCLSGFDAIPTASEEALDPRHDVPKAIMWSLGISLVAYIAVITVQTLMVPYTDLTYYAPLAEAFKSRGFIPGYYIVSIGALCAIFGSLLATTYAVTRLFYSLAYDGLISTCIARVGENRHIPTMSVVCTGVLTGILALCIEMKMLVELVSVSTITTYTMVSVCVLLSRYQTDISSVYLDGYLHSSSVTDWLQNKLFPDKKTKSTSRAWVNYQKISEKDEPISIGNPPSKLTHDTQLSAMIALVFFILCLLGFWTCLAGLVALVVLYKLPRNNAKFPFMVPMVVPVLSK